MPEPPVPNNLGPTLLLVLGVLTTPLLIGLPLVLVALAGLRTAGGEAAVPALSGWRRSVRVRSGLLVPPS